MADNRKLASGIWSGPALHGKVTWSDGSVSPGNLKPRKRKRK